MSFKQTKVSGVFRCKYILTKTLQHTLGEYSIIKIQQLVCMAFF